MTWWTWHQLVQDWAYQIQLALELIKKGTLMPPVVIWYTQQRSSTQGVDQWKGLGVPNASGRQMDYVAVKTEKRTRDINVQDKLTRNSFLSPEEKHFMLKQFSMDKKSLKRRLLVLDDKSFTGG